MNEAKVMNAFEDITNELRGAIDNDPGCQEVKRNGGDWTVELRRKHGKSWRMVSTLRELNQLWDEMAKMM